MITRAVGIINDNGEEVMIDLPDQQELLDRLYEMERDGDAEIALWKERHEAVCQFSFLVVLYAIAMTGIAMWGWLR
jgi:hypothetical protein